MQTLLHSVKISSSSRGNPLFQEENNTSSNKKPLRWRPNFAVPTPIYVLAHPAAQRAQSPRCFCRRVQTIGRTGFRTKVYLWKYYLVLTSTLVSFCCRNSYLCSLQ